MDGIIQKLVDIGPLTIILVIAMVVTLIPMVVESWKKLLKSLGLITKQSIEDSEREREFDELKEKVDQYQEDINEKQEIYHEQSIEIRSGLLKSQEKLEVSQNGLKEDIKKINEMVASLSETLVIMQNKNDSKDRARLKDRISQSYRCYNKSKRWDKMEKEAFNDLIRSYEEAGGKNSFIHSICEPESLTWEVIDEINNE